MFFATTFNYLDRQVISYLKEFFCSPGGYTAALAGRNTDFANLTSAFTGFYAGMTIVAGWVIDKIGTKLGLALSLIIWSIFGILNAFVGGAVMMHMLVRSVFGIGEGGKFSRLDQNRRRMVSETRTRAGHGYFQQRFQFRRDGCRAVRSVVHDLFRRSGGLENGFYPDRRVGISLADFLVLALQHAAATNGFRKRNMITSTLMTKQWLTRRLATKPKFHG